MICLVGHATTPDKLKLITGSAGDVDTIVSYMDVSNASPPVPDTPDKECHNITTAATTDILAGNTSATKRRNVKSVAIRNASTTVTNDVTVVLDAIDGNDYEITKRTLKPGEELHYDEGVGWTKHAGNAINPVGTNFATSSSAAGFATDTYIAGTAIPIAGIGTVRVGRIYHFRLIISKTAAGTATPILTVRVGTTGGTGDTGRLTFTWGAGTAAIDRGEIELECLVTTAGASAIVRGKANWTTNLQTTGLTSTIKALQVTSAAFDMTVASSLIGLSYNGGTSAVHTIEWASAWQEDL